MNLVYQPNSNLEIGIHELTWAEFCKEFGYNKKRKELIDGLRQALLALKDCGCSTVYVDGSFVTKKMHPRDFDVCYDNAGIDYKKLVTTYPVFIDMTPGRQNQKAKYKGELMVSTTVAKLNPKEIYLEFFQHDREGNPKGIIKIKLDTVV